MSTKTASGTAREAKRAEAAERAREWRRVDNTLVALGGAVIIFGASLVAISAIHRSEQAAVKQAQQVTMPVPLRTSN